MLGLFLIIYFELVRNVLIENCMCFVFSEKLLFFIIFLMN